VCVLLSFEVTPRRPRSTRFPYTTLFRSTTDLGTEAGTLVRWTFDLDGNTNDYTETQLADIGGEFPRFDERFVGHEYRHGYYATMARPEAEGAPFDTFVHVDLKTGNTKTYEPGEGCFVHEPVFVPRTEKAEEGNGYLVSLVYDGSKNLSDFIVLDTDDISKGPIAKVELPTRVPFGFHGNWADAS